VFGRIAYEKVVTGLTISKRGWNSSSGDDLPPDLRPLVMSGLALSAAGANVIMQLSRLAVGHGVVESSVDSGSLYRHPVKRTRTTLGYLMIAMLGTQRERDVMRLEVNRQHHYVVSRSDGAVAYNAFDPDLQLWVAACMYRGLEDVVRTFHGSVPSEKLDVLYQRSARLATTLQVPPALWPADRNAFEDYWQASLDLVEIDDVTRTYLLGIASLAFLPPPLRQLFGPVHRFVTSGFLPERFRGELALPWNARRQAVFKVLVTSMAFVNRFLPRAVREFPFNVSLYDARRRIRSGRRLV
jgi:uncharacterized protein (DUF2236 family)